MSLIKIFDISEFRSDVCNNEYIHILIFQHLLIPLDTCILIVCNKRNNLFEQPVVFIIIQHPTGHIIQKISYTDLDAP